jgi:dTDP-4-amino-4,6-dideoxygalactose transaminase
MLVHRALRSQRLFRWNGAMATEFEERFARAYGVSHAVASTSGTSAIHVALGAMDLNPGEEVITTPITDMGTVIPILCQNAIPIFADINETYNISPASIEQRITPRTKAVIVVHIFGNPCDMQAIMAIGKQHKLVVVEDCSQAHMTEYQGRFAGTIGDFGCYSFQESKHMTTGDGGMTITNSQAYYERMKLFADKGCDNRAVNGLTHKLHAPNYRMTELTAAVGLAQLGKVAKIVERRNFIGSLLTARLSDVDAVTPPPVTPGGRHAYWSYPIYFKNGNASTIVGQLQAEGIPASTHMTKPLYFTAESLRSMTTYGSSQCPFSCVDAKYSYGAGLCPNAESLSGHLVNLWINENWSEKDIDRTAKSIRRIVAQPTIRRAVDA